MKTISQELDDAKAALVTANEAVTAANTARDVAITAEGVSKTALAAAEKALTDASAAHVTALAAKDTTITGLNADVTRLNGEVTALKLRISTPSREAMSILAASGHDAVAAETAGNASDDLATQYAALTDPKAKSAFLEKHRAALVALAVKPN
jgi:hypothetical protein